MNVLHTCVISGALVSALTMPAAAQSPSQTSIPARPAVEITAGEASAPQTPNRPAVPTQSAPVAARVSRPSPLHINGYALFGSQMFTARKSFEAVFGNASVPVVGGGAQVWHRSGLFVQGEFSKWKKTGQRAFIHNGTTYQLGIPLRVEADYLDLAVGYKFVRKVRAPKPVQPVAAKPGAAVAAPARPAVARAPGRFRLTPYVGIGFGRVTYREYSDFAEGDENPNYSDNSYHVIGGIEVPVWRWLGVNVEGVFRGVPGILGLGGISKELGEKDFGGPALRVKVTVGL